jgi:polysaccharide biosynthesis protein PslF
MISTYPPTRCGIGRFSRSLVDALYRVEAPFRVDIVRLLRGAPGGDNSYCSVEIDPDSQVSLRVAARFLNQRSLAVIQHEFGIFGRNDGVGVLDLADKLHVPLVSVLHTVLRRPTEDQHKIISSLGERGSLVVLCESARSILADVYNVPPSEVAVIHHGAQWSSRPPNPPPRRRLITWGLLGPGKGLERSIRSMAILKDLGHAPEYLIVGRTHPQVLMRQGPAYRRSLEELVDRLGLDDSVKFVDRYLEDDELEDLAASSDIVVVPYDNSDQVSSGVVTDALGLARPVVATDFPYAHEMLDDGSGLVVAHDPMKMAYAIERLMVDEDLYLQAAGAAQAVSRQVAWDHVARRYARLLTQVSAEFARA